MRHAVLVFLFVAACGGKVVEPGPSGSSSSSSSSTSSSGGDQGGFDFPVCPADPPKAGASCPAPGQGCRYVSATGGDCSAYACEDGRWRDAPEGC